MGMRCSFCGANNPEGMRFCGACGKELVQPMAAAASGSVAQERHCIRCGRSIDWNIDICPYCGYDFKPIVSPGKNPTVGGILTIMAGIVSFFLLIYLYLVSHQYTQYYYYNPPQSVNYDWMIYSFFWAMSIIAMIGGMATLARKYFSIAVVGSACAVVGPGFFFGIPGLVIVAGSAKDFEKPRQMMRTGMKMGPVGP